MQAILIGATGATGKDLLNLLLKDDSFERVLVFARRDINMQHEKLKVYVIDFEKPAEWQHLVIGDVLFSCLGTTLKTAGSKKAQWKVDYDYQYEFARAASKNGVSTYVLISAAFANASSPFFYTRMKGELEQAVKKLGFDKLLIFNPPVLVRDNSGRPVEVLSVKVISFLNRLGLLRSSRPLRTITLAQAMINATKKEKIGFTAYNNVAIQSIARGNLFDK